MSAPVIHESCGRIDPEDRKRRCILLKGHEELQRPELVPACAKVDPGHDGRRCHRPAGHSEADCTYRAAIVESFSCMTDGDPDFSEGCQFFRAHGLSMTREKATQRLAELLESSLSDPQQLREVSDRFSLHPPVDLGTDHSRAQWVVDQIAVNDLWDAVNAFRTRGSSGCSCRLEGDGHRWGAGGRHYLRTTPMFWYDRTIDDNMAEKGIGRFYRGEYISGLSEAEIGGIEDYAENMAGRPMAYERCPAYARGFEGRRS